MASCLVAPSSSMRIKVLKRFFKRWKTNFMQEMESSGEGGRIKGSENDLSKQAMKLMMVVDLKCFT